jgi:hypothetical protein
MKTESAVDQVKEPAPKTLKEILHVEAKTLGPEVSVQEACDELRSEGVTSSPVTDRDGQLPRTVSESQLNRKVGGVSATIRRSSSRKRNWIRKRSIASKIKPSLKLKS